MKFRKVAKGHLRLSNSQLEVVQFQKWNGYAYRPMWKLIKPARMRVPEKTYHVARLLDDIKIFIRANEHGVLKEPMKPRKLGRAKVKCKSSTN